MEQNSAGRKDFITHIERYLGPIQRGWSKTPDGHSMGFQIAECFGGKVDRTHIYCTIGLSDYPLPSAVSNKTIRHELMVAVPDAFDASNVIGVLHQLASIALKRNSAFLRGEVIEGASLVFQHKPFNGFYITMPVILPEDFNTYTFKDNLCGTCDHGMFAWLVPITKSEAGFVREKGWEKFEELLESKKADLIDLNRPSYL